jgi:hypothetical protein
VRRVVLYKNGIGYFEHLGKVRGSEDITIDFNSAQLDDVLTSLTALDLGNGRVSGISYNSDAPVGQRLGALRLQLGDQVTRAELFGSLRGARLELRAGERVVTGRLLGVERRVRGNGPTASPTDELTLVSDAGEIRTMELTPTTSVKLSERDSADQLGSYLSLLASTRAPDRRRMTISTAGSGERDLLVSYVSEVPIWKTTYRVVLSPDGAQPLLQGWAIVDNTTGEDWTNVDLSLVAGAPQSFIEHISQPYYARRPVVQPPPAALLTPQTHEATLSVGLGGVAGAVTDPASSVLPGVAVRALDGQRRTVAEAVTDGSGRYVVGSLPVGTYRVEFALPGFQTVATDVRVDAGRDTTQNAVMRVGAVSERVTVTGASPSPAPSALGRVGAVAGGVIGGLAGSPAAAPQELDRAAIASRLQDVQASATARELSDLFEYRVNNPISIHSNESALVPIISSRVAVERVSLWNGRVGSRPLRALWLTNSSGLTLDGGSFTVLDDGAFAGEGLVDPLKPQEKRLLSYAVDLGTQIESRLGDERRFMSRVVIQRGVVVEHREQRTRRVYTIRNNDTVDRTVVIEHPTRTGWTLLSGPQPVETSATAYRFRMAVPAKQTTTLTVEEKQPIENRYEIASLTDERLSVLVRDSGNSDGVKRALQPILAKKSEVAALATQVADLQAEVKRVSEDEQRVRENLVALKGTPEEQRAGKRYAAQLTQQEDRIDTLRREAGDLDRMRREATDQLQQLIDGLALDIFLED